MSYLSDSAYYTSLLNKKHIDKTTIFTEGFDLLTKKVHYGFTEIFTPKNDIKKYRSKILGRISSLSSPFLTSTFEPFFHWLRAEKLIHPIEYPLYYEYLCQDDETRKAFKLCYEYGHTGIRRVRLFGNPSTTWINGNKKPIHILNQVYMR